MVRMNTKLQAVEAYSQWWNTRPEPHVPAPRECAMQEDKMMAVWLSAWDASSSVVYAKEQYEADYENAFEHGYAVGFQHGKDLPLNISDENIVQQALLNCILWQRDGRTDSYLFNREALIKFARKINERTNDA